MKWLTVSLILLVTAGIPFIIAVYRKSYPDLDILLTCYSLAGFLWIGLLAEFGRIATLIELNEDGFMVKKFGKRTYYPYAAILAYNERPNFSRIESFSELTIYLSDNWFFIRSNEFNDYDYLKDRFTQHGLSVPYQNVLSLAERNRFRWLISGLALLIIASIVFGYIAYNPAGEKPAQLKAFTDVVNDVREDRPKGRLHGVILSLRTYPGFSFYISRRNYTTRLDSLRSTIVSQQPITVLIRESDYRKKLRKTESLTFGDKYDDYNYVMVFGFKQGNGVNSQTSGPVYEPTHTNPRQRTILLSILLLVCWAGWVYVDRHKILRTG